MHSITALILYTQKKIIKPTYQGFHENSEDFGKIGQIKF